MYWKIKIIGREVLLFPSVKIYEKHSLAVTESTSTVILSPSPEADISAYGSSSPILGAYLAAFSQLYIRGLPLEEIDVTFENKRFLALMCPEGINLRLPHPRVSILRDILKTHDTALDYLLLTVNDLRLKLIYITDVGIFDPEELKASVIAEPLSDVSVIYYKSAVGTVLEYSDPWGHLSPEEIAPLILCGEMRRAPGTRELTLLYNGERMIISYTSSGMLISFPDISLSTVSF